MKRIALLFMAAAVLAACQKEKENVAEPAAPGTYTYTIEAGHGETRTDYAADGAFTWTAGDQISVLFNNGTQNKFFTLTAAAPGATAVFSGEIEEGYTIGAADGTETDKKIWALYPASDQHTYTDGTVSFYVQPSADFTQTGFSANIPMYDLLTEEGELSFKNMASTYKFTVKNLVEGVQKVKFEIYNQTTYGLSGLWPIHAGEVYVDYGYAAPGSEKSTLTYISDVDENHQASFFVSCRYYGNFQPVIRVYDADHDYLLKEFTAGKTLQPSSMTKVQKIALSVDTELPPVFVDGKIEEWADVEAINGNSTRILEWKYISDENNLYFLFKIDKSKISAGDWGSYIYTGYDTDNDSTSGADAGAGVTGGFEAMSSVFAWRGDPVECFNGKDTNGQIACPVGTKTDNVTVAGTFDGDYCYVETCVPLDKIGSPNGNITVKHGMNYYVTDQAVITVGTAALQPKEATITAADLEVKVGKSKAIGATTNSSAAIAYESGDTSIATVTSDGTVTGVAEGSTTITLSVPAVEGYYTAATKTINVTVEAASAAVIEIDGDMSDWESMPSYASEATDRIQEWKFFGDSENLYFYIVLRKNRTYNTPLTIGFDWDDSGSYGDGNKMTGCELKVTSKPFTNAKEAQPVCVNGFDTQASINGSVDATAVYAFDYDNGSTLGSSSSRHYLELSIPRSKLPSLPASGTTINIATSYDYYLAGFQSITLP